MAPLKDKRIIINNIPTHVQKAMNESEKQKEKVYIRLGLFYYSDVKEAVLEYNSYKIYTGQFICSICNKRFFAIFSKNNVNYCQECLSKKIFGDFEK